jgi:pimeloyl-ACP methyl ester carboxylesterase
VTEPGGARRRHHVLEAALTEPATPDPTVPTPWLRTLDGVLAATLVAPLLAAAGSVVAARRVYRPRRRPNRRTPGDVGLDAESLRITADDGAALDAWFVPRTGARHTVVISHGMAMNKAFTLPYAALLHRAGYHVLTFDLRNHGDSDGDRGLRRMADRFSADLARVLASADGRPETASGRLALVCFSFSTWAALLMASRARHPRLDAVVCDSGPALDISGSYDRLFASRRGSLPAAFRGPILGALSRAVFTRSARRILAVHDWPPALGSSGLRTLFVAGELDPIVPPHQVERLAAHCPGAEVWVAPGASHTDALRVHPGEYERRLTAFLALALAPGAARAGAGR